MISACGLYRFRLERMVGTQGPVYAFFGINPSTADASVDDHTVRKWIGFTKTWGGSRFIVGNVWPLRSALVDDLAGHGWQPQVLELNRHHLQMIMREADVLVPCWGSRNKVPVAMHHELDSMLHMLRSSGKPLRVLGLTVGGDPRHPLTLGYATPLQPL